VWEDELANHALASLLRIHDQPEHLGIVGREVGTEGMEPDPFRFDLRPINGARRDRHPVAARLEAERQGRIRMQVAQRTKRSDDDLFRSHNLE